MTYTQALHMYGTCSTLTLKSEMYLAIYLFVIKGEEAIQAKNVFYYLTYTGAVDLESVSDPKLRKVRYWDMSTKLALC